MTELSSLADNYARLKAEIDQKSKELVKLRDALIATGQEKIVGNNCIIEVSLTEPERLNADLVRTKFPAEMLKDCLVKSLVTTLRIKPKL